MPTRLSIAELENLKNTKVDPQSAANAYLTLQSYGYVGADRPEGGANGDLNMAKPGRM